MLKRAFEPHSPGLKRRLEAMEKLAQAGILVGTSLMRIVPFVGDDEGHLEDVVRATQEHGGSFVLAGGMTLEGVQAERTLAAARRLDPELETRMRQHNRGQAAGKPDNGSPRAYNARLGLMVRELCARHGLKDRMPRYVGQGPLSLNKRMAERLFLKTYDLELELANKYRIWAYRKAAWVVDEWPDSIADLYRARGESGLRTLPGIGQSLAQEIARWLQEDANTPDETARDAVRPVESML
jgi:hypothetical protein